MCSVHENKRSETEILVPEIEKRPRRVFEVGSVFGIGVSNIAI